MRFPGVPAGLRPAILLTSAAACVAMFVAIAPSARANIRTDCQASSVCTTPTPTPPAPTPTPTNAFLSLDITSGDPSTQITVNGGAFLANEQMTLYWDPPSNKVAGGANADASGNFTTRVKPFSGDTPGTHHLCASVPPLPCANFTLRAATASPSPSSSPSPSDSPTPSPTATPTDTASPTPVAATVNGLDVIMKPPFVILPIIGALGLLVALGYFVLSIVLRPRQTTLKSVAVSHLATRPDYAAGFGAPPAAPGAPAPVPSAWDDALPASARAVPPTTAPEVGPPPAPAPETPTAEAPGSIWGQPEPEPPVTPPAPDEPPDLPEPSDY